MLPVSVQVLAQDSGVIVKKVRTVYPNEFGVTHPVGLSYAEKGEYFFALENMLAVSRSEPSKVVSFTFYEDLVATTALELGVDDALNMAFNNQTERLFLLQSAETLVEVSVTDEGILDASKQTAFDVAGLALVKPQGMAIDSASNRLFVLDGGEKVVSVLLDEALGSEKAMISTFDLSSLKGRDLRGLALHPITQHLYLLSPSEKALYELTPAGELVETYDLASLGLTEPQGLVFAPSADLTDAPETVHLFIADQGQALAAQEREPVQEREPDLLLDHHIYLPIMLLPAGKEASVHRSERKAEPGKIVEVAFVKASQETEGSGTLLAPAVLEQTIDLSGFDPPSPDSAGVVYLSTLNRLLVSDSEVNEIPALFTGDNLFEIDFPGVLNRTGTTLPYSDEPTGVGFNPSNGHIFISDDRADRIFEVDPGTDGQYGTSDDGVTSFRTRKFVPKSRDPEGVTFDTISGDLFIADGINEEIYRVDAGANGIFDGTPSDGGDDVVTNFDVSSLGISDPEGIHHDAVSDDLFIVGSETDEMYQVSTAGSLESLIDIGAANAVKPAGITMAPGSSSSNIHFYIADRGIDNNDDPDENDGKIYEMSLGAGSPPTHTPTNTPEGPTPTNTPTLTPTNTPVGPTATNTPVGPTATNTPTPTATNTPVGPTPTNTPGPPTACEVPLQTVSVRVSKDDNDAEENNGNGAMSLLNNTLSLVENAGNSQTVGVRFRNVTIPSGAEIVSAYIEFEANEVDSGSTSLVFQIENENSANSFKNGDFNISRRSTTGTTVNWPNIPAWTAEGQKHQTPDLAALVQEVVNRTRWGSGNAMVFIITGSGKRVAKSYDIEPAAAPLLVVEYCVTP